MTWTLLAPALAIVGTLGALAWSMQRIDVELGALRTSLRRSRAASVALSELERSTTSTVAAAEQLRDDARARAELRRTRARHGRR